MNDLREPDEYDKLKAVALYFVDNLALRSRIRFFFFFSETADTVGCCSLGVEYIGLSPKLEGERHVIHLIDFLGKDSVRYRRSVGVNPLNYKKSTKILKTQEFSKFNIWNIEFYHTQQVFKQTDGKFGS